MPEKIWAIVGPPDALECLAALIDERRRLGPVYVAGSLDQVPTRATAVLQVGGQAPRAIFLSRGRVPIGWLPDDRKDCLTRYARAAAQVVGRQVQGLKSGPVVLLGQWHERTLKLVDDIEGLIALSKFRWTAERLVRRELLNALRCGPGTALYFGHALSGGWLGYGGISAQMLIAICGEPLGSVVSIACETARRINGCPSFCEELVLGGFCGAALGASAKTLHDDNRVLARGLCSALGSAQSLADALEMAKVPDEFFSHYCILGDPAVPLIGAANAEHTAKKVFAPAPDQLMNPKSLRGL
jgi:hypothetical protein